MSGWSSTSGRDASIDSRRVDREPATTSPSWLQSFARGILERKLAAFARRGSRVELRGPGVRTRTIHDESPQILIDVLDPAFYTRTVFGGDLGAAESFIRGEWTTRDLTTLLRVFAREAALTDRFDRGWARFVAPFEWLRHAKARNSKVGSRRNIRAHYDLGNRLFEAFLDPTLSYSSAVYERPGDSLETAQRGKNDRICRKLKLTPNHHLLEIGTGWGGFAIHAAKHYGCRVTTTTISREQHAVARERIAAAGLADRITLLLKDYRDLDGTFDRLVSIEMIEAVGHRFLPTFFRVCRERLADDGAMLIQAISMPDHRYDAYRRRVDFIQHAIFPGSCCPSLHAMTSAAKKVSDFRMLDLEDLTPHYARTLFDWQSRFVSASAALREFGATDDFVRMWRYYLSYCEAGFAERAIHSRQIVWARPRCGLQPDVPSILTDPWTTRHEHRSTSPVPDAS